MTGIIGKKIGMTQLFDDDGNVVAVTVVQAGPCPVTQVRTLDTDGYEAVQLAFEDCKDKHISRPELGHLKKAGVSPVSRLSEVRLTATPTAKAGDVVTVEIFKEGQLVDVIGVTKGKGFQGVVRRFRVAGGPASHGSMFHRRIGAIGMRQTPGRVFKNQKMPGHMGSVSRTVQNLKVVKILADKNLLLIRGAIPGANGSDVIVRSAIKAVKA